MSQNLNTSDDAVNLEELVGLFEEVAGSMTTEIEPLRKRAGAVSRPWSIKPRRRRNRAEMQSIRDAIVDVLQQERPASCRQIFYQLVSRGIIGKTEAEYKGTVIRLLVKMREDGEIPYGWLVDHTRWMRKPNSYGSMRELLRDCTSLYRRDLWRDAADYVEVWLEKEALSGVLYDITSKWDVPLMVTKGYASVTFLQEAAETLRNCDDRACFIYNFGDHDPSGVGIAANIEKRLRQFAPGVDLNFERIAVTPEQIEHLALPTRPTKRSDSRAKSFHGESVDVDAIPPNELRELCEDCITRHIDEDRLELFRAVEEREKESIEELIRKLPA